MTLRPNEVVVENGDSARDGPWIQNGLLTTHEYKKHSTSHDFLGERGPNSQYVWENALNRIMA